MLNYKCFILTSYSSLIIPTQQKADPEFIFSPLIGINGHVGIGAGINVQIPLTEECSPYQALFFADIDNRYYLSNTQYRTFDLNKPQCRHNQWSRYLQVRKPGEERTTFAANILTLPVEVKPYNRVNLVGGLRAFYSSLGAELGYQLWAHGDERFELEQPACKERRRRFTKFGIAGSDAHSAHRSNIKKQAPDDRTFITIKSEDINFRSAASRGTATHTFYGSVSYKSLSSSFAPFVNLGAFVEFAHNNAVFSQWGIWGKMGAAF